ncbi:LamG-like jellyroll fold domain-containing protein [Paraflavisolibacter sp. H34]|uniref:LamG-like jellyroll fold domain-containing protein n=1 Tax=Huijunlia imazamoxiresistens TaxID=3127457 RepID=UPI003017981C
MKRKITLKPFVNLPLFLLLVLHLTASFGPGRPQKKKERSPADITAGTLVGHWKMNESGSTTITDHSGTGNHATLLKTKDVTWPAGQEGLALSLPGTLERYATAPNTASLNITDAISIAAWIRPIEVRNGTILAKGATNGYELCINSSNKVEFRFNTGTNGSTYRIASVANYPTNATTWVHVAATYDGATARMYINGVQNASVTFATPAAIISNTGVLTIGSLAGERRWKGAMDDLRLYRGALTADEVQTVMNGTPPAPPPAPVLVAPADGATNVSQTPTLSWNTAAGATRYGVQVSEFSNFSTLAYSQENLGTTSVQPTGLAGGKLYYWRVHAGNSGGDGDWSATRSFTTALPLPAAPTLVAPADGATNQATDLTLSWNAASNAQTYSLEISAQSNFSTTAFSASNLGSTSVQAAGLAAGTQYFWRVRGVNSTGGGNFSLTRSFTTASAPPPLPGTPTLSAPGDGATNQAINPTLSWTAASNAQSYRVEVSENSGFSPTVFAQSNISGTSVQAGGLAAATQYFWRVRATNATGDGDYSLTRSFTTASAPPPGATALVHYWNFNDTFHLQPPAFTLGGGTLRVDSATTTQAIGGTGQNFAGINARNGEAAGTHFRLNNPIGSTVTFGIPSTGFDSVVVKYETRRSGTGAGTQQISYSLDGTNYTALQSLVVADADPVLVTLNLHGISGTANNANLKLRIQFVQGAGGTAGNNRFDNLTVEGRNTGGVPPPGQVTTLSPADGAQNQQLLPELSWQAVANVAGYHVQVATSDQFTTLVAAKTVSGATRYQLETPLAVATTYFWRVRAANAGGDGSWSVVKSFRTINSTTVYQLAINEVMSSNNAAITDEDGDFSDWIELYNYGTTAINLQGFGLSDDYATPFKWVFPSRTLNPGAFLLVWASSKNRTPASGQLHTNFAIGAEGEEVVLTAPGGSRVDSLPAIAIPTNVSRGREPNGTGTLQFFSTYTPGASNIPGYREVLPVPIFSVAPGVYSTNQSVALSHSDASVTIRYTLDGSIPTASSPVYSLPFTVTDRSSQQNVLSLIPTNEISSGSRAWEEPSGTVRKGTIIRARAFKAGADASAVTTGTYLVLPGRKYTLPVVSVVSPRDSLFGDARGIYVPGDNYDGSDETGNYYMEGDDWERPGSIEYFGPDLKFQQNIGLRINGDFSRRFPQKSLRVIARTEYGKATLDYPIFPNYSQNSFKRWILRNSGNDWGHTMFKDALAHMLVSHIMPTQHYRPSVVFINGEYWGIHNFRERPDRFFVAQLYGVDPDNIDYLVSEQEVEEGDAVNYNEMLNYIRNTNLSTPAGFAGVTQRMDVDNFADYFAAEAFYGNTDWPQSNIDYWRARVPYNPSAPAGQDGRWRWLLHDVDLGLSDPGFNAIEWITDEENGDGGGTWPNELLRKLLTNQDFKFNFINRMADQLNTAFLPTRVNALIDSIKAVVEPEIPEHELRWGRPSLSRFTSDVDVMKTFATQRPSNHRSHIRSFFGLGSDLVITLNCDRTQGSIKINSLTINSTTVGANPAQPYPWQGTYFGGVPLTLKALPNPGFAFVRWQVGTQQFTTEELRITPSAATSITAIFTATSGVKPTLTTPVNGATGVAVSPSATLSWSTLSGASSYRLQVSLSPDFATTVYDQSGISGTSASVSGLQNNTVYHWRVAAALTAGGTSNWSDTWSFTTVTAVTPLPGAVTLSAPANGATGVPTSPNLVWNAAANAANYSVQVATSNSFTTPVVNRDNVGGTSASITGLSANTVYFWRVRAHNGAGSSDWSAVWSFTTAPATSAILAGHWRMNEGSGTVLSDASGNANHATFVKAGDVTWVTGKEALAVSMPGTTDRYARASNAASLNITSAITVAAWIRPIEVRNGTILAKGATNGYELFINSSGKVEFRFNTGTNGSTYRIASAANYPTNATTWAHVAATYDGATARMYINGVQDASVTFATPAAIISNTGALTIGSLNGSQRWKGAMDDLRLYGSALSASEIAGIFAATNSITSRPLQEESSLEKAGSVRLYPNPVSETIHLAFPAGVSGKVSVRITDVSGKQYLESASTLSGGLLTISLLQAQMGPGVYFLAVKSADYSEVFKFVKN